MQLLHNCVVTTGVLDWQLSQPLQVLNSFDATTLLNPLHALVSWVVNIPVPIGYEVDSVNQ